MQRMVVCFSSAYVWCVCSGWLCVSRVLAFGVYAAGGCVFLECLRLVCMYNFLVPGMYICVVHV